MTITQARTALYARLYRQPLYEYTGADKRLTVRILGSGDAALEAVKAVFWVGQMSRDDSLSIACEGGAFRERVMQAMPGLDERYASFLWGDTEHVCGYVIDADALPEDPDADEELLRFARNVNFAYATNENQRTKKTLVADFAAYRDDLDKSYDYWSSMAAALHMPYKLRVCRDQSGCTEGKELPVLREAIREKNELYNILLEIEHRRWCAYMISEGWQRPAEDELPAYAFRGGRDHRHKEDKLHPCLCDGCVSGCHLRERYALFDEAASNQLFTVPQVRAYCERIGQAAELTELDFTSLALHAIAAERCREAITEQTVQEAFSFLDAMDDPAQKKLGQALYQSVLGMLHDAVNSVALFETTLRLAREDAELGKKDGVCDTIKRRFDILRRRNRRLDMAAIDEALIDMIPFVLWYGKDYSAVITFSDGNASDDVIVPTMIVPETAVFIGKNLEGSAYSRVVEDYFRARGDNVHPVMVNCGSEPTLDRAVQLLTGLTGRYPNAVLNSLHSNSPIVSIAMGYAAAQKQLPIVTYDHARGITDVHSGEMLSAGLTNKGFTMSEFIRLMQGSENNADRILDKMEEQGSIFRLFQQYSQPFGGGQSLLYRLSEFLNKHTAMTDVNLSQGSTDEPQTVSCTFDAQIYRRCGLEEVLKLFDRYRIICDLSVDRTDKNVKTQFRCRDESLLSHLDGFTDETAARQTLQFLSASVTGQELKRGSLRIKDIPYPKELRPVFEALHEAGFLDTLKFSGRKGAEISCTFRDKRSLELFKTSGRLLELVTFNRMKNTGLFDDVQTGVKLSWNASILSGEEKILRQMRSDSEQWGFRRFKACRNEHRNWQENHPEESLVDNELDVVAMKGMQPVIVSCKDRAKLNNSDLEQLYALCSHFGAKGFYAVTKNRDSIPDHLLARAKMLGIEVLDRELLLASANDFYFTLKAMLNI